MANEYYARIDYIYDGGDATFSIPFDYINESDIVAIIDDDTENPITDIEFMDDHEVHINAELAEGSLISIRRTTPLEDRIVWFNDGDILNQDVQNISADQVFYAVQEIKDSQEWLLAKMSEFTTLKSLIDEALATITQAARAATEALDANSETRLLIDDMTATYQQLQQMMKEGLPSTLPHNLFEICVFDKTLQDEELTGLAPQNSTISNEQYPDAYRTVLEEYESGQPKVFTTNEETAYHKSYTGSSSGDFYLPSDKDLTEGETVYSDEYCLEELGTIENLDVIEADKYIGTENEAFYAPKDDELQYNKTVYSDEILNEQLGTVEEVRHVSAYKYTSSSTGEFYTSSDVNLRVGRVVYQDAGLLEELGTITKMETIESDKYIISGLEEAKEFYVPKGTVLNNDTDVYKDPACTDYLGTIIGKGTKTIGGVYYYVQSGVGTGVTPNGLVFAHNARFYTQKEITESNLPITIYNDSACTAPDGTITQISGAGITITGTRIGQFIGTLVIPIQLISSTTGTSYNYIKFGFKPEQELSYYKQSTVEAEIIAINEGENESYSLDNIVEGDYIKIADIDWQQYYKAGSISSGSIIINKGEESQQESYTYNGLKASDGVVFEYREASNGHKIVLNRYKSQIDDLKSNNESVEFYVLNIDDLTVELPLLVKDKNIYFCVGNTVIYKAIINDETISKNYLEQRLENYVPRNDKIFIDFMDLILDSTAELDEVYKRLSALEQIVGDVDNSLSDILGE